MTDTIDSIPSYGGDSETKIQKFYEKLQKLWKKNNKERLEI